MDWDFSSSGDYTYDSNKISVSGGIASLPALDFTDDANDATGFAGGTHTGTQWDATGYIKINDSNASTNCTDYYTSRVLDAGASVPWNGTISWVPDHPSFKELPNNDGVESAYTSGNIDMTNNVFLIHANESAGCTTVSDTSGDGNNLTNSGGVCGNAGVFGSGLTLYLANDLFSVSPPGTTNITGNEMTVCAWVKPRVTSTASRWNYFLYAKKGGTAGEQSKYEFGIYGNGMKAEFKPKDNTGAVFDVTATSAMSTGIWYHVCGRYSVSLGYVSIFVDGLKKNYTTTAHPLMVSATQLTRFMSAETVQVNFLTAPWMRLRYGALRFLTSKSSISTSAAQAGTNFR